MSQYYVHAIILEDRPFREYDRIISIYTRERGKMDIRAVGSRKIQSKLASHLTPIKISQLLLVDAKFLPKVISALSLKNFSPLMKDEEGLRIVAVLLRLVRDFTREGVSDEEMYFLISSTLYGIQELLLNSNRAFRLKEIFSTFFLSFISLLGYAPKREQCFVCRRVAIPPDRVEILEELSLCQNCFRESRMDPTSLKIDQDFYTLLYAASRP